jgi:methionyl-tRNA formyltransferase
MDPAKEDKIICIAGRNDVACSSLAFLVEKSLVPKDNILALPNSAQQPAIRDMKSLTDTAEKLGVKVISDLADVYRIDDLIFFSLEFDRIIKTARFSSTELFNIHFSMLPRYKGMYTSAWPILNGEKTTGITLHKIDDGIDTGEIIDQYEFPIELSDTCRDLYFKYNHFGFELFKANFSNILNKKYKTRPQPSCGSSYYSKSSISYDNVKINLAKTAFEVHNQIRAFIFPEFQLPKLFGFNIIKSEITKRRSTLKPGTIVEDCGEYMVISTIDYDVKIYKQVT